jgi:hypothetical protein
MDRKWLVVFGAMLVSVFAIVAIGRGWLRFPISVGRAATGPGTLVCLGTVVSIEINPAAIGDKLRNHDRQWVVTVRPDDGFSGNAHPADVQFMTHSPSASGFGTVGERVEVFRGGGLVWARPCGLDE